MHHLHAKNAINGAMETNEQIFIRVVEAGSLKAAAEQLGSDPSTISRKLTSLEERLGVRLIKRSTRRSSPTEAGIKYYEGIRRLRDEQSALEASISGESDKPRGLLRVTAPLDFGARFIVPVLHEMVLGSEGLKVELLLGSTHEDIIARDIDVAIRIGELPDSSLICRRLGSVPRVLVGSPDYLARRGQPMNLSDLSSHEFIFYSQRQERQPVKFQTPDGKTESVKVSGRITVNSVSALCNLVRDGAGLHVGPRWAFADGICSGEFVQILPDYPLQAYPLHALYASAAFVPAKIRTFINSLIGLDLGQGP